MKKYDILSRPVLIVLAAIFMVFSIIGCSSDIGGPGSEKTTKENVYNSEGYANYDESPSGEEADNNSDDLKDQDFTRKMIYTAAMDIETLEYDKCVSDFEALVEEYEGFVQDSRIESSSGINSSKALRQASFKVRIPADKLDAFRKAAGNIGTVTVNTKSGDDVTEQYYDAEARLNALEIQEERLLALLEKAETLTEIIELEDRLSELRYEIEDFTGKLNKWDALVAMSTLQANIYEVRSLSEPDPENFGQQISRMFTGSIKALVETLKSIALGLVAILPFLVLFGGIAVVIIIIAVRVNRKKRRKREAEIEALRSGLSGKQE